MPETLSIWMNIQLATMTPGSPYGAIKNSAIAVSGSRIAWIGKAKDLPDPFKDRAYRMYDGKGAWVTPGLVDCHTHLVYAGNRAGEFELRLQGVSYEEISRRGGGILSTVFATRDADEQELFRQSAPRLESMLAQGVTTVEIKSGYGLDVDTELKMLRVARLLEKRYPVTVVPTFLGAHALPPEFRGDTDAYIDFVCRKVLPEVAGQGLAVAADAFCDTIGFTREQTEKVFRTAREHGLMIRLHAEQFSNQGGAELAAGFKALSADHLEHLSEEGAVAMAKSNTVAVLLPGAFYFIREKRLPPVDLFRRHAVPMAVSTDCNPGTSPTTSLLLMLNMACTLFGLTPEEALAGATIHAAKALGLENNVETLEVGKDADFVLWDITSPVELAYAFGVNPCRRVIRHGEPLDHGSFVPLPDAH